jgi:hypothetical protein
MGPGSSYAGSAAGSVTSGRGGEAGGRSPGSGGSGGVHYGQTVRGGGGGGGGSGEVLGVHYGPTVRGGGGSGRRPPAAPDPGPLSSSLSYYVGSAHGNREHVLDSGTGGGRSLDGERQITTTQLVSRGGGGGRDVDAAAEPQTLNPKP